jgi:hypothetical protein
MLSKPLRNNGIVYVLIQIPIYAGHVISRQCWGAAELDGKLFQLTVEDMYS